MKRIALLLFAATFVYGCTTSATSTVTPGPDPVKCQVALSTPTTLDAGGGSGTLAVTTQPECAWNVSSNVNWISAFSPASGQGTANVSFRVSANEGSASRDGMIVVNDEQLRLSQRAPCRYDVRPSSQSVASEGGAGAITVATANDCSWTAASDSSWISLSSSNGNGNGSVNYTVAPNPGSARTGEISIANQRSIISQAGISAPAPACNATISPTSQSIAAAGGAGATVTVSAPSTCRWTASSGVSWITIGSGASGTGNGTVTFTVAANTGAERTGTLSIAGRTFTVTQGAASSPSPTPSCSYSISPRSDSVPVLGGTGSTDVSTTSSCAWTATSNVGWISITSGASGTGNGRVTYVVSSNVGASRTGTLTVAGQTLTVTQAALVCSYSISPNSVRVESGAGTGSVSVSTSSTCTWTAESNASWIRVTSGASGTGNGTVSYSYTANTGNRDREGTLTVAGRTFTVDQREPRRDEEGVIP